MLFTGNKSRRQNISTDTATLAASNSIALSNDWQHLVTTGGLEPLALSTSTSCGGNNCHKCNECDMLRIKQKSKEAKGTKRLIIKNFKLRILRQLWKHNSAHYWIEGRLHLSVLGRPALIPSDILSSTSWDLLHHIVQLITGSLFYGEIDLDRKYILDVGTGSGIWMKQMSMQFPSCQFVGCDIVDQTSSEPLPSQCKFVNGDILKKLPFENDQFDLIRQSFLIFHIPGSKWQPVARELFRVCKANGTINLLELDWRPTRAGPLCGLVANALEDGQNKLKMDCRVNTRLSRLLVSAGFVDVTTRTVDVPLGYWGDNIGACMYQVFSQVMNSAEPMFRRLGTFAPKELDLRVDAMKQELDASYTASITLFIYSARKSISSSNAKH